MAKVIMIQGTMSNAGKSLLAAALCRIFHQDGYRVAPFKSQNMALNSFITKEGLEMGRAQVMQAEAAGIEPSVLMNPILLKPTNDIGSQVIVNGKVLGNMNARDYFAYKKQLVPDIMEAYNRLAEEYDIIVIEGAGSPAEINLKQDDIVNMGMAEMVDAPVLLVSDIDRGGVFAQLYGTVMLLEEKERARIKGLVINKFRGDKTILDPGITMIEEKTGIDVVGVLPYMKIQIEDEDSLSERLEQVHVDRTKRIQNQEEEVDTEKQIVNNDREKEAGKRIATVDLVVIRYPRISNFTDCNVFDMIEGVTVRYVTSVEQLGHPDMVILPGSKNTMKDLLWMRQNGLEAAIKKMKNDKCVIFGICGGYQMLGSWIHDPEVTEEGGSVQGMGLLPVETIFQKEKTRTQVTGTISELEGMLGSLTGTKVEGYEIHMGSTEYLNDQEELEWKKQRKKNVTVQNDAVSGVLLNVARDKTDTVKPDNSNQHVTKICNILTGEEKADGSQLGNVYGTYIHGFFDADGIALKTAKALAEKKGMSLEQGQTMSYQAFKETQYDMLAETARQYLDMEKIYTILNGLC